MTIDEKIKTSDELEFAVFCIENVAAKLGVMLSASIRRLLNRATFSMVTLCRNMKCCIPRAGNISLKTCLT